MSVFRETPIYSIEDVSKIANNWHRATVREFRRGLFFGAPAMAVLVTICRAFGWL